jgi:hypothetical protein
VQIYREESWKVREREKVQTVMKTSEEDVSEKGGQRIGHMKKAKRKG